MANDERERLRKLVYQKEQLLLESRAGMAVAVIEHFGEEAEEVIKNFIKDGARSWAASAAQADLKVGRKNDIQGLVDFLWEPLLQEGFEFTYGWKDQGCQMRVTRCPVAEIAKALGLEGWGYILYCMGDDFICEGYNPEIRMRRTKTLMEGDEICDHLYYYREGSKST